ncbi:MAG: carbohydrate kinase family protein [Christensenellales bacterium]
MIDLNRKFRIICFGQAVSDVYSGPYPGDFLRRRFTPYHDLQVNTGGDTANAANNFAGMGCDTRIIACVGKDALGRSVRRVAERFGVDTRYLMRHERLHTATTTVWLRENGRTLTHAPSCNREFSLEAFDEKMIESYDHLYYASVNSLPKIDGRPGAALLKRAKEMGLSTSMDSNTGKGHFEVLEPMLEHCDIYIPNHEEIEVYTGLTDMQEIKAFFSRYPIKVLGVKRGRDGLFLTDFKEDYSLPTLFEGTPVDQLGAGDALLSTFVLAYKYGFPLKACGQIASAAAALCLSMRGASLWGRPFAQVVKHAVSLGCDIEI